MTRRAEIWTKSTGPRTAEGKARSSRNAWKGGRRPLARGMVKELNACFRQALQFQVFCDALDRGELIDWPEGTPRADPAEVEAIEAGFASLPPLLPLGLKGQSGANVAPAMRPVKSAKKGRP